MANLNYSIEAKNVLNKFHSVEKIVYVEGGDDIIFWEFLFKKFSGMAVKAEEVGGRVELQFIINEIKNDGGSFLVAIDSDFDWLYSNEQHPQIFSTFGYSIENSIISAETLQSLICRLARVSRHRVSKQKCQEWLSDINKKVQPIVMVDIANRHHSYQLKVLSDNCNRFLLSKKSSQLCCKKIAEHIMGLGVDVPAELREEIMAQMNLRGLIYVDILRGHFLISAALQFIKEYVAELSSAVSISREMLFGSLMLAFEVNFNENHKHYEYYQAMFN